MGSLSRRIRAKKKTAEELAAEKRARDFQSVGLSSDSAKLAANQDIGVERASRGTAQKKAHDDRARRFDAFEALRSGMADGAYDAARRLERDITTRRGEHDRGRMPDRVDNDAGKDRTDAMVDAGRAVDAVLTFIGDRDTFLLCELIDPSPSTAEYPSWRERVAYLTGETHTHAQAAVVRMACRNLAGAYAKLERLRAAKNNIVLAA